MESTKQTTAGAFTIAERAWFDSYRSHHFDRSGRHVKRPGAPLALIIWGRVMSRIAPLAYGIAASPRLAMASR